MCEDIGEFRLLLSNVEGHCDCSKSGDCKERDDELIAVAEKQRYPVAWGYAPPAQSGRQARDLPVQLAPAQSSLAEDQSFAPWVARHAAANMSCSPPGRSAKQRILRSPK